MSKTLKIGQVIKALRTQAGRTLNDVANAADTDPGNLSRLEKGSQEFSQDKLAKVAQALGTSVPELYARTVGAELNYPNVDKANEHPGNYGGKCPASQSESLTPNIYLVADPRSIHDVQMRENIERLIRAAVSGQIDKARLDAALKLLLPDEK